jgi:hypothetical protein
MGIGMKERYTMSKLHGDCNISLRSFLPSTIHVYQKLSGSKVCFRISP